MPFDAREAKQLQPGAYLLILPDHPGLRLTATATKRTWIYRYKSPVDDGMRQVKIGEWPRVAYDQAVTEWRKLKEQRDAGTDPALQKKKARKDAREIKERGHAGPYLIKHLVEDYLTGHIDKSRKPKSRKETRRLLERNTAPIAEEVAENLRRNQAFKLLEDMSATPVLAQQVRQEMGAATNHALDAGKLPSLTPNWWKQILRGKLRSKGKKIGGENVGTTKRALNDQEIGTLINWLPNFSLLVHDALILYLWTGTRGAELMSIEKHEITEESTGTWWTVPKEKTKNVNRELATDLRVPLFGRAKELVLRRAAATDRYIFACDAESGYTQQKAISEAVYTHQPYAKRRPNNNTPILPVTRWTPHDLRRSVRTLLAKMGCPGDVAESVLGHMQGGIVGTYNRHTYDAERLEWLQKLDVRLEQLAQKHRLGGAS